MARAPLEKARRSISPGRSALIPYSRPLIPRCERWERDLRARRTNGKAYPSARQTLIVTSGAGRVQRWGGPVEEIRPGDVVWIPPGEKHWHGASPTVAMMHIAIQEALDGKVGDWLEKVSDEQYNG